MACMRSKHRATNLGKALGVERKAVVQPIKPIITTEQAREDMLSEALAMKFEAQRAPVDPSRPRQTLPEGMTLAQWG